MTIGLTWRRTARRIKRLNEAVLGISPDYSDRPTPDFLTLSIGSQAETLPPRLDTIIEIARTLELEPLMVH